jgi:hypothetical protein
MGILGTPMIRYTSRKRKTWPNNIRDYTEIQLQEYIILQNKHLTDLIRMHAKVGLPETAQYQLGLDALAQKITEAEDELDLRYEHARLAVK